METNSEESGRLGALERQMRDVGRRLAALEQAASARPGAAGSAGRGPAEPAALPADRRSPGDEPTVSYSGAGRFGDKQMVIRQQATLSEVLGAEPEAIARVFAALSSPARVVLLRALISGGPRTTQQLREELDDPSVGQLYHHLRELLAAGLVVQPSRSVYAAPPGKAVSVCVAISAAMHLMSTTHQYPPPPGPADEPAEEEPLPGPQDE